MKAETSMMIKISGLAFQNERNSGRSMEVKIIPMLYKAVSMEPARKKIHKRATQ
jgi:hypothetical protein